MGGVTNGGIMDLQFANAWETVADVVPEHDAIVQGERRFSYRAFDDLSARFASALTSAWSAFTKSRPRSATM